jgi:TraM recognition site of TraD and TraG/Type IV secretion-system coupling protein DNA-binding domain
MLSTNPTGEPGVNPLAPLEQLAHWLMGATIQVVLGLSIGMIVARLMRSRHLHWSWAATGVALAVLLHPAFASLTSTLGVAALGATIWGRRWHREDIDAGSDLAEIAAGRRGPLDVLRSSARGAALRRREILGAGGWLCGEEMILGQDESRRAVSIPFGGASGGTHTLVVGATGSGKTVTQTWMAVRAIEHGMGAIVVDPKGDHGMRGEVCRAAQAAGSAFIEWTPGGPSVYNPYARGSETEIADKALAGERFTEPHYLRQAQRYLGHVVRALRRAELEVSLRGIVDHMDPARLECLVRGLPEAEAEATHAYLDSLTGRQQSDLAGVRDRLAILSESDVGLWLDPQTLDAERFDLLEAVRARAVVYFSLESDSRPLLTQMLGAAIVQDLQTTVAALQRRPVPTLVVIDEFSAVAAEQVVRLFGRARSAGFSLLLCTQELSDLRLPGRERLLEQVMGNLSVLIAHRQVVPESAELIASLAGTKGAWRTSRHSDGRMTRTRTREGALDSSEIVSLGVGWAAVFVLVDGASVRVARIFSASRHR